MDVRLASPAHLLLKIESFSLLSKQCESPEFEAGDYKWRLVIRPNGLIESTENDEGKHISVYLTIVETSSLPMGWEVTAAFSIFLYNHISDDYICFQGKTRRFHAFKSQWGFSKLVSKETLRAQGNGFLVDDICVFGAEVAVVKSQTVTQSVFLRELNIPYKCEFKISDFSKLRDVWKSEEFAIGDLKWYIKLYPYGYASVKGRSVSMFLYLGAKSFASHKKVKADYYLRIKNQLNDQHHSRYASQWFTPPSYAYGWRTFLRLSDVRDSWKGFVVKDCCIVEVEMFVKAVV